MKTPIALLALPFLMGPAAPSQGGVLSRAIDSATKAVEAGDLKRARFELDRVLERDPNSLVGWNLVERWAGKASDKDELVHALHRQLSISRALKKDKASLDAIRTRLQPIDPLAGELEKLRTNYVEKLTLLGASYEKSKRPHSSIRAYKQALALDPDRADIRATIERIASAPDPSLAEDARPRDLLEGISAEWIAAEDKKHIDWKDRYQSEKPNYRTQTNAGYEVLVRTAEAMEQMNAFYRVFFRYGAEGDKRSPSRIDVNIFRLRSEYTQDPKDWSGGHYTGSAVETYIGDGGFEDMTGTLFHEAAHQFVDLATNAEGWLNEGLASFFEGTRILANGTVVMNLPATHRLFPLVERMKRGFMADVTDGIDPNDVTKDPSEAPTFRIVLENQYEWGPPWYAPTWGVVFFLYNFQDTGDGRFLYRKSFWDFVDASGGKMGETAIQTFEELVLGNPAPATPGIESTIALAQTVDQLNEVWKRYLFELAEQQSGARKDPPPYLEWAKNAKKRGALDDAGEFLERAWQNAPDDVNVLEAYAEHLGEKKSEDRASKLLTQALALVENAAPVDKARVDSLEQKVRRIDPAYQRLDDVRSALIKDITAVIERYLTDGLNLQAMELAFHLGSELQEPALFALYERGVRAEGRSIAGWRLAYNEEDLRGWNYKGLERIFQPAGEILESKFETFTSGVNDYKILSLDQLTSGDYSLECEVDAQKGKVNFAGLVFGRKSSTDCHVLVLFPPAPDKNGFADLATFPSNNTWRRNPVSFPKKRPDETTAANFYKLRVDVTGRLVDVWVNGEYLATQEFASLDVLRGTFGLITGRGEARFRNVRFLGRAARDPSAAIERKLTLEEKTSGGESINGSWLGLRPPFPGAKKWYQGERKSWDEAIGYPQLFVMWSIAQNDAIPIDAYLRDLFDKNASIGLRIVNLLAFWDEAAGDAYLADHPFPDALALDTPTEAEHNFGVTFERFEVTPDRFHLPRFILLDIDGKVYWEGDPGFAKGEVFTGQESLLDTPLRELVAKRKLTEFTAWRKGWPEARAALARGQFEKGVAALKGAAGFDASVSSEVAEAAGYLAAIEGAAGGVDALAERLTQAGREPALEVLCAWAEALGKPVKKSKALSAALKSPNVAAWKRAPSLLKPLVPKVGKDKKAIEDALSKVAALPGAFPAEFAEAARVNASDAVAFRAVIDDAGEIPALWLASEHFGW